MNRPAALRPRNAFRTHADGPQAPSGRVRVRGHHPLVGAGFRLLVRVPLCGRWLAWALVWPVHRWVLAYYLDGQRIA